MVDKKGAVSAVVLLLVLGNPLPVVSENGDSSCEVPTYPENITVLLDSWKYYTLLHATNVTEGWYNISGCCEQNIVAVCASGRTLLTRKISKRLPTFYAYPVRVFVNMTYSFDDKCTEIMNCESYIELQLALYDKNQEAYYDSEAITPNNVIEYSPAVGTKQIFFDLDGTKESFALALTGRSMDPCFTLSRVLVYRQMCPDEDECKGIISARMEEKLLEESRESEKVFFTSRISANVTAQIATRDGTAIGNFDYVPISETVVFENEQSQWVDIKIVNDELAEGDESFTVDVLIGNVTVSSTNIIIASNTGSRLPCTEGSVTVVSDVYNSSLQLVEMCSSEGVWSPVCDYNWTIDDATVVCRELEYTYLVKMEVLTREGASIQHSNEIPECRGNENKLISCLQPNTLSTVCNLLLVECKDPLNTVISDTTVPTIDDGGVQTAAVIGVNGVIVLIIALIVGGALLIVFCVRSKRRKNLRPDRSRVLDSETFTGNSSEIMNMKANPVYGRGTNHKPVDNESNLGGASPPDMQQGTTKESELTVEYQDIPIQQPSSDSGSYPSLAFSEDHVYDEVA